MDSTIVIHFILIFLDTSPITQTEYSSELTMSSQTFVVAGCRMAKYYEAVQINVIGSGYYTFHHNSSIDVSDSVYENDFDPLDPSKNIVTQKNETIHDHLFDFIAYLETNRKYILVVTTTLPDKTGPFSIIVFGPNNVRFSRLGKCLYFTKLTEIEGKIGQSFHLRI
jgi:hypothetical protein